MAELSREQAIKSISVTPSKRGHGESKKRGKRHGKRKSDEIDGMI